VGPWTWEREKKREEREGEKKGGDFFLERGGRKKSFYLRRFDPPASKAPFALNPCRINEGERGRGEGEEGEEKNGKRREEKTILIQCCQKIPEAAPPCPPFILGGDPPGPPLGLWPRYDSCPNAPLGHFGPVSVVEPPLAGMGDTEAQSFLARQAAR